MANRFRAGNTISGIAKTQVAALRTAFGDTEEFPANMEALGLGSLHGTAGLQSSSWQRQPRFDPPYPQKPLE